MTALPHAAIPPEPEGPALERFKAALEAMPRLYRAGYVLDLLLCVIVLGGGGLETLSHFTARRQVEGARWACIGCYALSLLVEPSHCSKTLAEGDTSRSAMWRAGLAMVCGIAVFVLALHLVIHLATRLALALV